MKKIDGVESANVSLNQGLATIRLKPGNSVRMEQIRKRVTEQGFTPRDAKVTALGQLVSSHGKFLFKVRGAGESYEIMPAPHAEWKDEGKEVLVNGLITQPKAGPAILQVLSVTEPSERK